MHNIHHYYKNKTTGKNIYISSNVEIVEVTNIYKV